jgi:2-dehydropantoate 2-reductase
MGGALAKAAHPVTLLVRPGRRDHLPKRLTIECERLGSFEAPVQVSDRFDGQFDVVWITVKATALEATLRAVAPEKLGDGVIVPLLNGVDHIGELRERYGAEQVLPGTIRVEVEQIGPGRVRHLSLFADTQVTPSSATRARAEALCEELRGAELGCDVREDEVTMLWSKLCFLAPFALAITASGGPLGVVRSDAGWWTRLEGCVKVACAVGVAEGAKVAPEPILAAFEGRPTVSGARCKKTWRRGGRRSLRLSRDPSSVAARSTASTCQRPAPFGLDRGARVTANSLSDRSLLVPLAPSTLRRSLSRLWCWPARA